MYGTHRTGRRYLGIVVHWFAERAECPYRLLRDFHVQRGGSFQKIDEHTAVYFQKPDIAVF